MDTKTCTKCGEEKPIGEFGLRRDKKRNGEIITRRQGQCKVCINTRSKKWVARNQAKHDAYHKKYSSKWWSRHPEKGKEYRKKRRFETALWSSEYEARKFSYAKCTATVGELEATFTGRCHVCGISEEENGGKRLCMDHCHRTGEFRGWLCGKCNRSLGALGDSIERILELALYLERVKQ